METISLEQVLNQLELGELSYNQFYNAEIEASQYFSIQHYYNNPNDNMDKDQILKILFADIEVYKCDLEKFRIKKQSSGPINAVTFFDNISKCYYVFALIMITKNYNFIDIKNSDKYIQEYKKELLEKNYIKKDEDIKIFFYVDEELKMLEDMWSVIHKIDPTILSGFNSHYFDYPYIYYRLKYLFNEDEDQVHKLMSKFGIIKSRNYATGTLFSIPEYPICDLRRLYMSRDEGGLNYGKKLSQYSLDSIAEKELNIKKIKYEETGLDQLYEKDLITFIKYNICDVALCVRLNEKLKHIELHNMLRRDMKTPFSSSMVGVSSLFTSMFNYTLQEKKLGMRWGLLQDSNNSITEQEVQQIERPKEKSIKWNVKKVDEKIFRKVLSRFVGAYVKEGLGKILTIQDGILVDMDASSLYPSMMMQNNISFDSYYGRVLDPECYIFINMLSSILGTDEQINPSLKTQIMGEIKKFVKRLAPQNMNDYNQYVYYMFMYLLNKLKKINIPLKTIFEGKNRQSQLILKSYLIPLLDLIIEIKKIPEYHTFAYEYLLNNDIETNKSVFIFENENEYSSRIINIPTVNFEKYLIDNNISFNLSGALFYTHEYKIGILNNFLIDRLGLREQYKTKRDENKVGSDNYQFYDRRQLAMKINANSSYGLTGMSNFLFSNRQLAMSTTLSGRLCLKISQACGELYLKQLEEKYKENV